MVGNKKKIWKNWLVTLFICVIAGCVGVGGWFTLRENELNEIQKEALTEVIENSGEYAEDTIVLQNTTHAEAKRLAEKFDATLRITSDGSFATLKLTDGRTVEDVYSVRENRIELTNLSLDYYTKTSEVAEEEEVMERLPASPNYVVTDSEYELQSYIDYVNVGNTWNYTRGSGITVAVIDTGIDTDHPEFAGRISEYSYNATEDKIVKDYTAADGGYDWSLIEDEQGHGTAVTGVIASAMDGNGVVGIASEVNIIVIKAECDENGSFYNTSDLVFGLYYAIERDVNVVNMSFGTYGINPFAEATQLAVDSDIVCVAAAGNDATTALTYPAADPNVIGVGALAEEAWELATYSNYGENTDVVAPGTTYTAKVGGDYGVMTGTSLASPVVAGAIALHMTANPYTEFKTVQEILFASTYDLGSLGKDWYYGYGALDINALVCEERGTVTFNMLTDELENTEQVFIRNHTLQNLPEPERNYAVFDGWYYDIHCTEELNWYTDKFTGDLTLYANWVNEDDGVPYTYVELEDGTIEIRSYTGKRRYITIPEKIDGKVVSSIGDFAFSGQTRLRQVNLPSGLNNIGAYAFENCNNLVEMNIPQGVKQIGVKAFYNNVRLTSVNFEGMPAITSIGDFAFSNSGLLRFEVPQNVSYLNGSAFFGASGLKAINVHANNANFVSESGVLYNNTKSTIVAYPAGLNTTFTLLDQTRTIGDYAFGYAKLKGVDFNKVAKIGAYAFAYSQLQSVAIPDAVKRLGEGVFTSNFYLKEVTLGSGITTIPSKAFTNASALQTINVPAQVQSIEGKAFAGSGLNSVTFAEGSKLVQIGAEAFYYVPLKAVTLPESLISIGGDAFAKNYFLEEVNFGTNSNLQYIGGGLFGVFGYTYSLTEIAFPANLQQIGDYAFQASGLTGSVSIPASVTYLGAGAFADCDNLTAIEVNENNANYLDENGVVYTKDYAEIVAYPAGNEATMYAINAKTSVVAISAFHGADNLVTVEFPSTLTNIEAYAFTEMNGLQYMNIPDEVIQISNYAFAYDYNLYSINFNETSKLPRISYAAFAYTGITSFRVPANVSTMAQKAFIGSSNLSYVTFAANSKLESISAYMFVGSENLVSITFEQGSALTSIQAHGLEGLSKLQTADFGGARLTNIDNFAFRFNTSLQTLNLPQTLTNIGRYAFYGCENMTSLTLPAGMEHIGRFAFLGAENLELYFASSTLPLYLDENWDYGIKGYYVGVTNVTTAGDWKYAQLTDGNTAIIEYLGASSEVDLTTLDFGTITQIGGYAFYDTDVTSIILPETLDSIQRYAFAFSQIENVTIPANVSFIGNNAFFYTPLKSVTFAENSELRTIEQSAFSYCSELSTITLPASLTNLGSSAFESAGLMTVTFAENIALTEIPEKAFMGTSLTMVTLPDSVTLVNHNAFRDIMELTTVSFGNGDVQLMSNVFYNTGLTTVNIPENVEYIGEYAFVGLTELTAFTVDENNEYYSANNGLLYNKSGSKLIAVPAGLEGELTLPNTVEVIGFGAFENTSLSEINFAADSNILTFGYRAFYGAKNLTEITIPASVVSIDYYAFAYSNIESVCFEEGSSITGIYEGAFYNCTKLKPFVIPANVVEISDYAFYGCSSFTNLIFEEDSKILGIYDYAFAQSGVETAVVPDTMWEFGNYSFYGSKLRSVNFEVGLLYIGDYVFANCGLADMKKIVIPETVLEIGLGAFMGVSAVEEMVVPFVGHSAVIDEYSYFGYIFGGKSAMYDNCGDSVPTLKKVEVLKTEKLISHAFYAYSFLEEIILPEGLIEIGQQSLSQCGFVSIKLPTSLKSIGVSALNSCIYLEEIIIPEGVEYIGEGAFSRTGIRRFEMPTSMAVLPADLFNSCYNLEEVYIHKDVRSIGVSALSWCSNLKNIIVEEGNQYYMTENGVLFNKDKTVLLQYPCGVEALSYTLPQTVKTIERMAFGYSYQLEIVNLNEGLQKIADHAFDSCYSLKEIILPNTVKVIGSAAYIGCKNVTRIVLNEGLEYIYDAAFHRVGEDVGVEGIVVPMSVIGFAGFSYSGIRSIEFLSGETQIGWYEYVENEFGSGYNYNEGALANCHYLEEVKFAEGLKTIPVQMFEYCDSLKTITIPSTVETINRNAFSGCSALSQVFYKGTLEQWNNVLLEEGNELISMLILGYKEVVVNGLKYMYSDLKGNAILIGSATTIPNEIIVENYISIDGKKYPVTKIEASAFGQTEHLAKVVLNSNLKEIGDNAFINCQNLNTIIFPEASNLEIIGDYAFNMSSIFWDNLILPESLVYIGEAAFSGTSLSGELVIGNNVEYLGFAAFSGTKITSVVIGNKVPQLYGTFMYCSNLQNVTFAENSSCTELLQSPFMYANLNVLELPESIRGISTDGLSEIYCDEDAVFTLILNSLIGGSLDAWFFPVYTAYPNTINIIFKNNIANFGGFEGSYSFPVNYYFENIDQKTFDAQGYSFIRSVDIAYFKGKWNRAVFYLSETELLKYDLLTVGAIVRTPAESEVAKPSENCTTYTFLGWDVNGDKQVDQIPATISSDLIAVAVYFTQFTGHTESDWIVDNCATCTATGSRHKECTVCGEILETEIIPIAHNYATEVTAPTCTEQGYTTYTCGTCGDSYVDNYVNAIGHKESDWIVDQEASIGVKGHQHKECTKCEEILEEKDIPALNKPQDSSSSAKPEPEVPDSSSSAKPEKPDSSKPTIPSEPSNPLAALGCFGAIHNKTMIMVMVLLAFTLFMSKKAKYQN